MVKILLAAFLLFISGEINSQTINYTNSDTSSIIEENYELATEDLKGLLIDDTTSKLGKDFYDLLFSKLEAVDFEMKLDMKIEEKPLPSLGSMIRITIEDETVFERVIQPRYDYLDELTTSLVPSLINYFQNYEEIQKSLAGEDLQGTGIY